MRQVIVQRFLKQGCGSGFTELGSGYGSSISVIPDPDTDPDPIRIQGFEDQKLKKKIQQNFFFVFSLDRKLQFTYVQAKEETFSLQKRTSSTPKSFKKSLFYVCESLLPSWIRIANTDSDTDPGIPLNPDLQNCLQVFLLSSVLIYPGMKCKSYQWPQKTNNIL
jgi:hypothetical protein